MALRSARLRYISAISLTLLWSAPVPASAQSILDGLTGANPTPEQQQQQQAKPRPKPRLKPRAQRPNAVPSKPVQAAATTPASDNTRRKTSDSIVTIMGAGRLTSSTQVVEDIANVLEATPNNDLRVLTVIGKAPQQNLRDMINLKTIDMAIVDQDILDQLKKTDPALAASTARNVRYISKLFSTEVHIYARGDVKSLEDLAGKKISCHAATAAGVCQTLFDGLKLNVQIAYDEEPIVRQKLLTGEVAAAVVNATPSVPGLERLKAADNVHFLPVNADSLPEPLKNRYQPAWLTHKDYPALIPTGEDVPTIASGSLLVAYAWPTGSARYQMAQKFVNLFFDNMASLRKPPRHQKWREVNPTAEVAGWTRFVPAQEWLDGKHGGSGGMMASSVTETDPKLKAEFDKFVEDYAKATGKPVEESQKGALYTQFTEWWLKKNPQ